MDDDQYKLHLLVVAPSSEQPNRLISGLRSAGLTPHTACAATATELAALLSNPWDLLLCYPTPMLHPAALLQCLRERRCKMPLLLVDAPDDSEPLTLLRSGVQQLLSGTAPLETHIAAVLREAASLQRAQQLQRLQADHQALAQRHDRLLQDSPIAHAWLLDGLHTHCNAAYARLFGFDSLATVASTPLLNLVHADDRETLRGVFGAAPPLPALELRGRHQDGSEQLLEFRFEALARQSAQWLLRVQPAEQAMTEVSPPLVPAIAPAVTPAAAAAPSPNTDDNAETAAALAQTRQLLRERRFRLLHQPLLPLRGTTPFGLQTFLQALDASGSPLAFDACVALAARHGLGEELDQLLLVSALEALTDNPGGPRLILTLGGASLRSAQFLPWLAARLRQTPALRSRLAIELSEIDIQDAVEPATRFCQGLAELGLPLVIGHFGCALAPFGILEKLSPALLRLDRSLLQNLAQDPDKCASTQELIARIHQRGLPVATCRTDEVSALPLLWQIGVDYAQGQALRAPSPALDCPIATEQIITLTASQL